MGIDQRFFRMHLVCFADILGFTQLSEKDPETAREQAECLRESFLKRIEQPNAPKRGVTELDLGVLTRSGISDSVFVTLSLREEGKNPEALDFVAGLRNAVADCVRNWIPVRGSVSIGLAYHGLSPGFDGPILVGPAVAQAASFEQSLEWIGVSLVPQMTPEYESRSTKQASTQGRVMMDLHSGRHIGRWGVPTEKGLQDCWVLTWPDREIRDLAGIIHCLYLANEASAGVASKYYSTLVFLEHQERHRLDSESRRKRRVQEDSLGW